MQCSMCRPLHIRPQFSRPVSLDGYTSGALVQRTSVCIVLAPQHRGRGVPAQVLQWVLTPVRGAWDAPELVGSLASPHTFFNRYIALEAGPGNSVRVRPRHLPCRRADAHWGHQRMAAPRCEEGRQHLPSRERQCRCSSAPAFICRPTAYLAPLVNETTESL